MGRKPLATRSGKEPASWGSLLELGVFYQTVTVRVKHFVGIAGPRFQEFFPE